jgi:hemerythrin-like domain-containing protein
VCEYCGCQQIASIDVLTREHDAVVAEIAEVRTFLRDDDVEGAAKTSRRIAEILGPHTAVEERGLFPLMAEEFPDHIEALEREHRLVEGVLAEAAEATPSDPTWPDRLLVALDTLRDHILKEQDGVFPAALSVLDADGWDSVEAVRARVGSGIGPERPAYQHNPHAHDSHEPHHHRDHHHGPDPDQEDHA